MIAVIFEVVPSEAGRQAYLEMATALRTELEEMEGFLSVERFESLSQPGKLLSLSFWRDDAAVARWRSLPSHRQAQSAGRAGVFADYRLRVALVQRDYGLHARDQAPADARAFHTGAAGLPEVPKWL
ncbi:MAG: antibiotic biosynthesis monooxygenase [Hydrogenophaga sp.]|uniref:antibiotic biosynthesis monooxygenase family protein n=1 Tax=Hydrogenophaga sp. TaxID=1904254 RepID=UPI0026062527|nr:antibiotic biosynthesis monooxygenase [Hydrogenophaga sp.]MDM7941889.1 antibiotic biosynthesis monooxygenase [Hydrogenophaga sp.]